ncbi:MAG: response regulator [Mariprofundus sp.]|nr:response regulator [Mariprofundus sp.]
MSHDHLQSGFMDAGRELKRTVFLVGSAGGCLAGLICAWLDWHSGLMTSLPQDFLMIVALVPLFFWARASTDATAPARIGLLLFMLSFIPSIPQELVVMPSFLLWLPVGSLLCFYFFGCREGFLWSCFFLILVVGECLWLLASGVQTPFIDMLANAVVIYLFMMLVATAFQYLIEHYERKITEYAQKQTLMYDKMAVMQRQESAGVLAAGVAHDFNNLLVGVMGNAELALLDEAKNKPVTTYLDGILLSSKRGAELVRQLLAFSGKGGWRRQAVEVNSLVEEVQRMLGAAVADKAKLQLNLAEVMPLIEVDPTQLQQLLVNLLVNASDAIDPQVAGEIQISTRVASYQSSFFDHCPIHNVDKDGQFVVLEVSDNGCGMTRAVQSEVFEPFYSTKEQGSGLGLAAVAGVMRSAGGAVSVSTVIGQGSCFQLFFPVAPLAVVNGTVQVASENFQLSGMVLVVDDEPMVREVAGQILEKAGLSVLVAAGGQQALTILEQHAEQITLLLLDYSMLGMNGYEVFVRVREKYPGIPVIISSGYSEELEIEKMTSQGAIFVQKPYRYGDLLAVLARHQRKVDKTVI